MSQTTELRNDARKDPDTLEREIDHTRAEMGQTLGALERKLSPGQIVDEVFGVLRQHSGELAANLGQSIKQNPLPVLVTAIGIGWMMFSSNRPARRTSYVNAADTYGSGADQYGAGVEQYRRRTGDYSDTGEYAGAGDEQGSLAGKYTTSVAEYGYEIGEYGARAKDKLTGAGERIKASAAEARSRVADTVASSKDAVVRRVSRSADTAQAQANRLRYTVQAQAGRVRAGVNDLFEEQPLILGALGIAIGAAVGAMLPTTEHENRVLGPIRDKTVAQIKERGAEAYAQARNTAEQAIDTLKEKTQQTISTQQTPTQKETTEGSEDFLTDKRNP
jgi:hypothetical protein